MTANMHPKMPMTQIEYNFWKGVNADNYSWDNLKNIQGDAAVGLSYAEIFHLEADKLLEAPNGKKYTEFHLPTHCTIGPGDQQSLVPTEKAGWTRKQWSEMQNRLLSNYFENDSFLKKIAEILKKQGNMMASSHSVMLPVSGMSLLKLPSETGKVAPIVINFSAEEMSQGGLGNTGLNIKKCRFAAGLEYNENSSNINIEKSIVGFLQINQCQINTAIFKECHFQICDIISSSFNTLKINSCLIEPGGANGQNVSVGSDADLEGTNLAVIGLLGHSKIAGKLILDSNGGGQSVENYVSDQLIRPVLRDEINWWRPLFQRAKHKQFQRRISGSLHSLELGAVCAKNYFTASSYPQIATFFYRVELFCREANPESPWADRLTSWLYRHAAGYGYSVSSPLVCLMCLWFSSAICYNALSLIAGAGGVQGLWESQFSLTALADSLSVSLSRLLTLFQWTDGTPKEGSILAELKGATGITGLATHTVALVETVASGILIFLWGLAVRRRFRMSDQ